MIHGSVLFSLSPSIGRHDLQYIIVFTDAQVIFVVKVLICLAEYLPKLTDCNVNVHQIARNKSENHMVFANIGCMTPTD